jgi:hypothetical protein
MTPHDHSAFAASGRTLPPALRTGSPVPRGLLECRINRTLMDPRTGKKLSNMRPDFFAFDGKGLVVLGEACNTQSSNDAFAKLRMMAKLYQERGFQVKCILTNNHQTIVF